MSPSACQGTGGLRHRLGGRGRHRRAAWANPPHARSTRPDLGTAALSFADGDDPDCGHLVRDRRAVEILPDLLGHVLHRAINTTAGVWRAPIARQRAAECLGANHLQIFVLVFRRPDPLVQWNGNDVIVFSLNDTPLQRVDAHGGTPTPVTAFDKTDTAHRWPSFLPDGQHFLYLAQGLTAGNCVSDRSRQPRPFGSGHSSRMASMQRAYLLRARWNPRGAAVRRRRPPAQGCPRVSRCADRLDPPLQRGMFSVSATGLRVQPNSENTIGIDVGGPAWKNIWQGRRSGGVLQSRSEPGRTAGGRFTKARDRRRVAGRPLAHRSRPRRESHTPDRRPAMGLRPGLVARRKARRVQLQPAPIWEFLSVCSSARPMAAASGSCW